MNKVILIGRLGKAPTLKTFSEGQGVCNFSIATTERWSKNGEMQEKTEWHNIEAWGKNGENCHKYLDKGSQVCVVGKIQTHSYEKEGKKHYATSVKVETVQFLDPPKRRGGEDWAAQDRQIKTDTAYTGEDIPF